MHTMDFQGTGIQPERRQTAVRIKCPCWVNGQRREVGEIVTVDRQDAIDLRSMKRAVILE